MDRPISNSSPFGRRQCEYQHQTDQTLCAQLSKLELWSCHSKGCRLKKPWSNGPSAEPAFVLLSFLSSAAVAVAAAAAAGA